ncbi:MAG: PadR family transcriptional regulator [Anaerolineae bacterium]|nr:PadR family transcriptional regulator [Anaerolineae bacterium]
MTRSNLLINEPPLLILPSLAKVIGLNESLVLQQLHYWLQNSKVGVTRNGIKWVYNTYGDWQSESFPFWSLSTIERTFRSLEKRGLVISEQLDAKKHDQRKYYRINYAALETLETPESSSADSSGESGDVLDDVNLTGSKTSDRRDDDVTLTGSLIGNTETTREKYMGADAPAHAEPSSPEPGKVDVHARIETYPQNTREATSLVHDLFGLIPPERPATGEPPGDYGAWDKNIKQIISICREYNVPLENGLHRTRSAIEQIRRTKRLTIHRPGSLIAYLRSELASGKTSIPPLQGNIEVLT